jgi:alkaline phosphatase D
VPEEEGYNRMQYKRRSLRAMTMIDDGEIDKAIKHVHDHLEEVPGDPELLFCLAVAHAQNEDRDAAVDTARKALNAGLPAGRFLAGPRELLAPLMETHAARETVYARHDADYIHGPLLGAVTDTTAQMWVRTVSEASVRVAAEREEGGETVHESEVVEAKADRDYTAVTRLEGLAPNTSYVYRLVVNGREQPDRWTFRTFPTEGEPAAFDIGFGACAGYTPWRERMWRRIAAHNFPVFLLLGDNVYIDRPERPNLQRYCYYRRQSRPEFRTLTGETSIAAIWDDHDFADNDSEGGPNRFTPEWKVGAWEIFRDNWNNASYGGSEDQPGVWHELSIADVDVFLLDGRYYRTNEDADAPSMLGSTQKKWLFDRLRASSATFKLIASPVPFPDGAKPGKWSWRSDTWEGYPDEREEIFSFIEDAQVDGVVLLAGDRHRADVWKIERERGYDLYEFVNARLTNIHTHESMEGSLYSYNEKPHFGRLRFDTTTTDPTLTYDIINIRGEVVHSTTLKRSQLTHG